jgi:hypothetical protein
VAQVVAVKVKGSAVLARKDIITRRFGADAWSKLVDDLRGRLPSFRSPIVASSLVPVHEFLAFHDELLRRFFNGQTKVYLELGAESAEWALTKGPYRRFLAGKDLSGFVQAIPNLSGAYWEDAHTWYRSTLDHNVVELEVGGLPMWHPYFEYLVVGYIKHALELLSGGPVKSEQVRGGKGTGYQYRFSVPP